MKNSSCGLLSVLLGLGFVASSVSAQVTSERLTNAPAEPQQWLMYSGAYDGSRFTPLDISSSFTWYGAKMPRRSSASFSCPIDVQVSV